jgi:TrmH family RNA methyltransferase
VTSEQNPLVRAARRLERDRGERERSGLYLAWGLHLAGEALAAGAAIERIFLAAEAETGDEGRDLAARLRRSGPAPMNTTARVLDSIVAGAGDQGVLLVVRRPPSTLAQVLERRVTLVLATQGVQDPGNVGSMVRTAFATGAGAFLALERSADPFSSRAVRAGMGAHFRLPIVAAASSTALPALAAAGFQVVAADLEAAEPPDGIDLRPPTVLCLGNEGQGLPAALLGAAAARVRIPMAAGASSLNVHAAAAILLYEAQRQRGFPGSGV